MSKQEFLRKLEELLSDVPVAERQEALRYYQEYIEDAGVENEEEVIKTLENPKQIAASVRENLIDKDGGSHGNYTERGYEDDRFHERKELPKKKKERFSKGESSNTVSNTRRILLIILIVLCSPVLFGLSAGFFGLIIGLIAGLFGIIIGFAGAFLGLIVAGMACIVVGIIYFSTVPATAMILIGVGFILGTISLLFLVLTVLITGKLVPLFIEGVKTLISRIKVTRGIVA